MNLLWYGIQNITMLILASTDSHFLIYVSAQDN